MAQPPDAAYLGLYVRASVDESEKPRLEAARFYRHDPEANNAASPNRRLALCVAMFRELIIFFCAPPPSSAAVKSRKVKHLFRSTS
jgi:hypothetical protein